MKERKIKQTDEEKKSNGKNVLWKNKAIFIGRVNSSRV